MNDAVPESMTPRELDILRGLVEGLTNVEIAERYVLSAGTVKWYVKQLYQKLNAHSREDAVAQALALGLVATPFAEEKLPGDTISGCPLINPLPQDVSGRYVGNIEKLTLLASLFQQQARLISIYGRSGSGKTALACKALGDLRQVDHYPAGLSGIVSLSAIGMGISLNRLLIDVGRLLSEKEQAILDAIVRNTELPPAQKIGFMLEKIVGKRIILLLDNLETIQQPVTGELLDSDLQQFIEMTLAQSSALTLLITSRQPILLSRALKTWEHIISLEDGLHTEDAITLLRKFDPSGVTGLRDAPSEELTEIVASLGNFPRALEAVAGMLLEDPLLALADVKRDLNALQGEIGTAIVEQALAHLNDEAMRVMQGLAIFGQAISYAALAYLLTPYLPESTQRAVLGRLIRACFVKANRVSQQLGLHPLDQTYCYNRIPDGNPSDAEIEPPPFTRIALHQRAAQFFREQRSLPANWRTIADLEPQLNEFKHWIKAGNGDEAARLLLEIDRDHLWEWGYRDLLQQHYTALDGYPLHDPRLAHHVARRKAWLKFFTAPQDADQEFTRLLDEAQRLGYVQGEADALDDLAQTFRRGSRDLQRATELHQQALALYRQIGDRRGEADALGGLGAIFAQIEPEEAIDYLLPAVTLQRDLGNYNSLSFALATLGDAYYTLGALESAIQVTDESMQIARTNNSLEALNRAYGGLARIYATMGNIERAQIYLEEATNIALSLQSASLAGQVLFWISLSAPSLALAGNTNIAVTLTEKIIQGIPVAEGQINFANYLLSYALLVRGDFPKARSLFPPDPLQILLSRSPYFIYWSGVLLIKTGERDSATTYFREVVKMTEHTGTDLLRFRQSEFGRYSLPVQWLAYAGLALLLNDLAMVATATDIIRRTTKIKNWATELNQILLKFLIAEPDGAILLPIRDVLAAQHR